MFRGTLMGKNLIIVLMAILTQSCTALNVSTDITIDHDSEKPVQPPHVCSEARIPAEWEPHEATWILWPGKYEAMYRKEFAGIIKIIQAYEHVVIGYHDSRLRKNAMKVLQEHKVPMQNISFEKVPNDNAWMRDNGPVYAVGCGMQWVQDWVFDAWGKSDWNNEPLLYERDNKIPRRVGSTLDMPVDSIKNYILEKGNLESNGEGIVILNWDCQNKRQPQWTKEETERLLLEKFGVNKIVWIPSSLPEEFTGGHIDGMARFIDKETVVVPKFTDQSLPGASVFEDAAAAIREAGLTVVRMDMPGTINYDPNQPGESAIDMEAVYVNWLVGNGFVLATGFGVQQWDESAKRAIEGYFPERDVHMISTPTIWYYGGGVHCVTNDQPGKGIIH